jgi:hypothetical protein
VSITGITASSGLEIHMAITLVSMMVKNGKNNYSQGYFCDRMCWNAIPEVLSQKNTNWHSIPETFFLASV